MERKLIWLDFDAIPGPFRTLLEGTDVYDSSCSQEARVFFLDRDGGLFLKMAPRGSLEKEAAMARFFCQKGLSSQVLAYESLDKDWLLTARVPGEDCVWGPYLENPEKLCDTTAQLLRQLHETDRAGCPVPDRTADYLAAAARNYDQGTYDATSFPDSFGYGSAEEAWGVLEKHSHLLKADTLLHGDYCLPNIILKDWRLSGFIDLGCGGVGDRHIDLFWGTWMLWFNLKTDRYRERFLDAYGRWDVEPEMLRVVAAAEVFG